MNEFAVQSVAYHAWFPEDFGMLAQRRAIDFAVSIGANTLTIGWAVPIDRFTGAIVDSAASLQFPGNRWLGTSISSMAQFARMADKAGLNTYFKPYFLDSRTAHNLGGFGDAWAETNVEAVKSTISDFWRRLAPEAHSAGVDAIIMGTENSGLQAAEHAQWWRENIAGMRASYGGQIGYSATYFPFHEQMLDARDVPFASSLDFVGVNVYARVSDLPNAGFDQAYNAWFHNKARYWGVDSDAEINILADLKSISELYGKPVVLTETGYPSSDTASTNPGTFSQNTDLSVQARLTQAELAALTQTDPSWFRGLIFFTPGGAEHMDWYNPATDNGWGFRGKPAEDVVRQYFGGNLAKNVSGTGAGDRIIGGSGRDVFKGNGGNDELLGWTNRDILNGGTGNDSLSGGDGNDTLYGNAGKDSFVFDTKPHKSTNKDAIKDFKVVDDTIRLDDHVFPTAGTIGRLKPGAFWANNTGKAHDRDDRIIYDKDSGILYYDADGTAKKAVSVAFAAISKNLALTYKDFYVI